MIRQPPVFLVLVVALAAASLLRAVALAAPLESNPPLRLLFVTATAAGFGCAVIGALRALQVNHTRNPWLRAFLLVYTFAPMSRGFALAWQVLELSIGIGAQTVGFGINLVGVALLVWHGRLNARRAPIVPVQRAAEPVALPPSLPLSEVR